MFQKLNLRMSILNGYLSDIHQCFEKLYNQVHLFFNSGTSIFVTEYLKQNAFLKKKLLS